jgi:hypothetical protein
MTPEPSMREIASTLTRLHEGKDRSYKDAWRQRGELIGIFCNVARKYDRLEVARNQDDADKVEPRADTAADLSIYSVKYVTWLIEHDPSAADPITSADSELWSAIRGHASVVLALEQLAVEQRVPPSDLTTAFDAIAEPFTKLERVLVDQLKTTATAKTALAWQLAGAALGYLWRLAIDDRAAWDQFVAYVASPETS